MFFDFEKYNFFISPGKTDMRCGATSLAQRVQDDMKLKLNDKSMFIFCGSNKRTIKILTWEDNGFWLCQKKLQVGTFKWPKDKAEAKNITLTDLLRLLKGEDIWRRLPVIQDDFIP